MHVMILYHTLTYSNRWRLCRKTHIVARRRRLYRCLFLHYRENLKVRKVFLFILLSWGSILGIIFTMNKFATSSIGLLSDSRTLLLTPLGLLPSLLPLIVFPEGCWSNKVRTGNCLLRFLELPLRVTPIHSRFFGERPNPFESQLFADVREEFLAIVNTHMSLADVDLAGMRLHVFEFHKQKRPAGLCGDLSEGKHLLDKF